MKKFFAIISILLVFSAQIVFAHEKTEKVKCEKPAKEYLKDAELYYEGSSISAPTKATAAALLYQICSELEKNTTTRSRYSMPSGHAIPDPPATIESISEFCC